MIFCVNSHGSQGTIPKFGAPAFSLAPTSDHNFPLTNITFSSMRWYNKGRMSMKCDVVIHDSERMNPNETGELCPVHLYTKRE